MSENTELDMIEDEKAESKDDEDMSGSSSEDEFFDDKEENQEDTEEGSRAFLPGERLDPGEELVMDDQAYIVYHQANLGAPCLSFDIIAEHDTSSDYPLQVYAVAGTQASKAMSNNLIIFKVVSQVSSPSLAKDIFHYALAALNNSNNTIKMSNLHPIHRRAEKSDDESSDEEEVAEGGEKSPKLKMAAIKHVGCVNRVRYKALGSAMVVAAWSETGSVGIWSLDEALGKVEECRNFSITTPEATGSKEVPRDLFAKPIYAFDGHQSEGFAIDWSPTMTGVLATGDCRKNIHIWRPADGSATWNVDQRPLVGHTDSVEDIQWSPNEANVLASCSVDKTIRIWDCRARPDKACMLTVANSHDSDVNVINWNANEPFIASGGDEGHLKIWDLRTLDKGQPVAIFKHHRGPVTSVEWHKTDSTVLASSGEDNQVALWDLAVEKDDEESSAVSDDPKLKDLPPQLLFIHQGLQDVKEVHWHPRIPGLVMATSQSGFDIFKTISV